MNDSTLLSLFALLAFCILMIWLVRLENRKIKILEKEGLEVDFATQMNPWKTYMIGGCCAVIALLEIIRKLFLTN